MLSWVRLDSAVQGGRKTAERLGGVNGFQAGKQSARARARISTRSLGTAAVAVAGVSVGLAALPAVAQADQRLTMCSTWKNPNSACNGDWRTSASAYVRAKASYNYHDPASKGIACAWMSSRESGGAPVHRYETCAPSDGAYAQTGVAFADGAWSIRGHAWLDKTPPSKSHWFSAFSHYSG
jgi:hypothetical protein